MDNIVTIFKDVRSTSTGFQREVSFIFDRIKKGKSKDLIQDIRNEEDSEKRNKLKSKLPAICFSGAFNQRADDKIIKHSGLICLDFDKFPDNDTLKSQRDLFIKDKYTRSVFVSPSGNGLKVIINIPDEINHHRDYFKALELYYDNQYFDPSSINISRVCYESYDKDIYINNDSELFNKKEESLKKDIGCLSPSIPIRSENQIVQNLMKWFDANFTMSKGNRNANLFKLAAAFNDFGVNKNEAERILTGYAADNFTIREIESIIKSAYNNVSNHGTKFFEDSYTKDKIEKQIRSGDDIKKIKSSFPKMKEEEILSAIDNIKESINLTDFWSYSKNGLISLSPHKYRIFLEQNGFYKMYPQGSESFIFVKIVNNIITNTTSAHIKDFVLEYLYNHDSGMKPYDFIANTTKFFKEDYLSLIDTTNVEIKEDGKNKCYLYYRNCVVEVSKNGIKEIDYFDIDGYVWENHIIDRDFKNADPTGCDFEKFIQLVTGNDQGRQLSMYSIIGYLLHSFKSSSDNKAIIFNDEIISENPNGGSGKGIICNALSHIKRVVTLDGKQFDFNKNFAYQTVTADTQLLVFDDVKKNFVFENLFSLVTEGITLEKKNKDAIKLPVYKSPKILITTNYTIRGEGGSFERRKIEIEMSSYFNERYTPFDEFKKMLFDDWDSLEWSKFDNFMIMCIQYYFKSGLKKYKHTNLDTRKLINNTSFEFFEWMEEEKDIYNVMIEKNELFQMFVNEYGDYQKWLTHKRFWQWIDTYSKHKGYTLTKSTNNGRRTVKINTEGLSDNDSTADLF